MGVYLWKLRELESYIYYHLPRAYLKTQRRRGREEGEGDLVTLFEPLDANMPETSCVSQ